MNVEIGAEAEQFPEKEYLSGIDVAVQLHRIRKMAAGFFTDSHSKPEGNQAPSFLELPKSRKIP